jgi:hypothetical protein
MCPQSDRATPSFVGLMFELARGRQVCASGVSVTRNLGSVRRTANIGKAAVGPRERFDPDHPFAMKPMGKILTVKH